MNVGRGAVDNATVTEMSDPGTGKVCVQVVESTEAPTQTGIVSDSTERGATVFTDEWRAYNPLEHMGFEHCTVAQGVGQYVDGMDHVNEVESFCSMLKMGYHGMYHKLSPEHLHRYVAKSQGRHSQRPLDMLEQFGEMVEGDNRKQTTHACLIAHGPNAKMREQEMAV